MTRSASPEAGEAALGRLPTGLRSPFTVFLQSLDETLSANTKAAYQRDVFRYLEYLTDQGVVGVHGIGPDHLQDLLEGLQSRGLAASTVARNTSSVRQFHRFLCTQNLCDHDPTQRLAATALTLTSRVPDVLSHEEATSLIESAADKQPLGLRNRAVLELLYGCGMTASELTLLNTGDVLLKSALVRILGKGARRRTVPIGEPAVEALCHYVEDGRPELLKPVTGRTFFLSTRGRALSRTSVWNIIQSAARSAGIHRAVSPQTLRHTFAAHLVHGGGDLRDVQQLLGHSSIATSLIYRAHEDSTDIDTVHRTHHPRA
jgi:integrase/recombinase XerD